MKPCRRSVPPGALLALACGVSASPVAAQSLDFHAGRWGGSAELGYARDREQLRSSDGSPQTTFERRRAHERLGIRNDGFFLADPRLATGNLALNFDLVQDRDVTDGVPIFDHSRLIGYAFDSELLAGLPYNAKLYANRAQNLLSQPFGRTQLAFENRGVTLQLREDSPLRDLGLPYLSANAMAEQQRTRETTQSVIGQSFQRDERQNILGVDAHKGFETADLDLRYQRSDLSDSVLSRASFRGQTAVLNYSGDFGPLLNRRWDSRISYYSRDGLTPISVMTVDENVHVDHDEHLATNYQVLHARTAAQASVNSLNSATVNLRYEPYRNLAANAVASAQRQNLSGGERDSRAGQLGLQYRYKLPGDGSLLLRGGAREQVDDNRLSAALIEVVDESHAAPAALGAGAGFLLGQPFVVESSIVVTDTRAGARLPMVAGTDYEIQAEGNLVRIVPLATSAIVRASDPLAVSYSYKVDPSIRYGTASRSASVGIDYRWIVFSIGHEETRQTLLSGQDSGLLQNQRKDTVQLDLRGAWDLVSSQGSATFTRYESTLLSYSLRRATALATYRPLNTVYLSLDADRTVTDFQAPVHRTDSQSARLSIEGYSAPGWTTSAVFGRRLYKDTLQPSETIDEARVQSRLTYGLLDLVGGFSNNRRTRAGFDATNWSVDLSATRRF